MSPSAIARNQLTVLVVGASRGIGRALLSQFAAYPNTHVIGSVRKPADGKFDLPNASSIILDLDKPDSIAAAVKEIPSIDVLMINAGMGLAEPIMDLDEKSWQAYLDVNVTGPWRVVKALLPALRAGKEKKVVFTSSMSGSMQLNYEGKASVRGAYAVTKVCPPHPISFDGAIFDSRVKLCILTPTQASINMFALQLHQDLGESEGFTVIPMHPGWVDTALGNPGSAYQGAMPPSESAKGIAKVVMGLKQSDSGKFFQFDGTNMPW